jgi:ABC-type polysaccharide/polyol phosphate export permease
LEYIFHKFGPYIHYMNLVKILGWFDIKLRYRRSILGPLWLTISMAITIGTISLIFGTIFNLPLKQFVPYVTIGIILWNFLVGVVTEGCMCFVSAEALIKQLSIPIEVHVLRVVWRNIIILGHNLLILPIVLLLTGSEFGWSGLNSIIGIFLFLINVTWFVALLGVLCTRYRDLPQIISSLLQILFYVTPIMWMPQLFSSNKYLALLELNPLLHLIQIVRCPLIGENVPLVSWIISGSLAICGCALTTIFYSRYKKRIAYWL